MAEVTLLLRGRTRTRSPMLQVPPCHTRVPSELADGDGEAERRSDPSELPWLVGGGVEIRTQTCNRLYFLSYCG